MALKGKIIMIGETKEFGSNGFQKREMAVETYGEYPQKIGVEFVKDKCSLLDKYNIGDKVAIDVNLRGNEWTSPAGEVRYFISLVGWKIVKNGDSAPSNDDGNDPLPF